MSKNQVKILLTAVNAASAELEKVKKDLQNLGGEADKSARGGLANIDKKLREANDASRMFAASLGIVAASMSATIGLGIKLAADQEQAQIAFTNMLGSAEEAKSFLEGLADFAAQTPFEMHGLRDASKMLLAFGFQAQQIIPIMTSVGNAIAAVGGGEFEIQRVVRALGQMQAKGKVSAEEMMQLAELGIPAWQLLADQIGTSIPEAMKLAEKGVITGAQGIEAIVNGLETRFGGMMEAQSQSLAGLFSTLKDEASLTLTAIGQDFLEAFNVDDLLRDAIKSIHGIREAIESQGLVALLKEHEKIIGAVAAAIVGALIPAIFSFGAAIVTATGPLLPFIALAEAIYLAYQTNFLGLKDIVNGFAANVADRFSDVVDYSKAIFSNLDLIGLTFERVFEGIGIILRGFGEVAFGMMVQPWVDIYGAVSTSLSGTLETIIEFVNGLADTFAPAISLLKRVGVDIGSGLEKVGTGVASRLRAMVGDTIGAISEMVSGYFEENEVFQRGLKNISSGSQEVAAAVAATVDAVNASVVSLRNRRDALLESETHDAKFKSSTDAITESVNELKGGLGDLGTTSSGTSKQLKTVADVFNTLSQSGTLADQRMAALGNTLEAQLENAKTKAVLFDRALNDALELGASQAQIDYLAKKLGEVNSLIAELQRQGKSVNILEGAEPTLKLLDAIPEQEFVFPVQLQIESVTTAEELKEQAEAIKADTLKAMQDAGIWSVTDSRPNEEYVFPVQLAIESVTTVEELEAQAEAIKADTLKAMQAAGIWSVTDSRPDEEYVFTVQLEIKSVTTADELKAQAAAIAADTLAAMQAAGIWSVTDSRPDEEYVFPIKLEIESVTTLDELKAQAEAIKADTLKAMQDAGISQPSPTNSTKAGGYFSQMAGESIDYADALNYAERAQQALNSAIAQANNLMGIAPNQVQLQIKALEKLKKEYPELSKSIDEIIGKLEDFGEQQDQLKGITDVLSGINAIASAIGENFDGAFGQAADAIAKTTEVAINAVEAIASGNPIAIATAAIDAIGYIASEIAEATKNHIAEAAKEIDSQFDLIGEATARGLAEANKKTETRFFLFIPYQVEVPDQPALDAAVRITNTFAQGLLDGLSGTEEDFQKWLDDWIDQLILQSIIAAQDLSEITEAIQDALADDGVIDAEERKRIQGMADSIRDSVLAAAQNAGIQFDKDVDGSLAAWRKELAKLRDQLEQTEVGTAEFNQLLAQIEELENRIATATAKANGKANTAPPPSGGDSKPEMDFSNIPPAIQFAVATPLVEAANTFLFAADMLVDALSGEASISGTGSLGMDAFATHVTTFGGYVENFGGYVQQLTDEGIVIRLEYPGDLASTPRSLTRSLR